MDKVVSIIAKDTYGKSYNTQKYCCDNTDIQSIEYDSDKNKKEKRGRLLGESINYKSYIPLKDMADKIIDNKPIVRYFLDGSRHVYKVDDIAYNRKVYPVIAGQVGIGVCYRENKKLKSFSFSREIVLSLPVCSNQDGGNND